MKKRKEIVEKIISKTAEHFVSKEINSACISWYYQPVLPKGAERFKK
ncbi:cyclic lactone autoinducer peptide [Anaeromicropila populeti]|uniref:Cyclic lactone autoinducer peptide n=1 Tax=Anaeromicropila populeti TaxID=37658 RepID=A0A1I6IRF3_9FIRM|nr:cyclic lactone autoinducer peptide [Anaeromicropila populeti]SFR69209.1 cyclic lactone autoinducer peptide [Anaeromicropila populeti]